MKKQKSNSQNNEENNIKEEIHAVRKIKSGKDFEKFSLSSAECSDLVSKGILDANLLSPIQVSINGKSYLRKEANYLEDGYNKNVFDSYMLSIGINSYLVSYKNSTEYRIMYHLFRESFFLTDYYLICRYGESIFFHKDDYGNYIADDKDTIYVIPLKKVKSIMLVPHKSYSYYSEMKIKEEKRDPIKAALIGNAIGGAGGAAIGYSYAKNHSKKTIVSSGGMNYYNTFDLIIEIEDDNVLYVYEDENYIELGSLNKQLYDTNVFDGFNKSLQNDIDFGKTEITTEQINRIINSRNENKKNLKKTKYNNTKESVGYFIIFIIIGIGLCVLLSYF